MQILELKGITWYEDILKNLTKDHMQQKAEEVNWKNYQYKCQTDAHR